MLKIRLQRVGRKHEPVFRVVLTDSKNGPKSGKFKEILGSYDARKEDRAKLKDERIKHWISQGAQTSGTIHNLLVEKKVIEGKKVNVLPKKKPVVKEKTDLPAEASAQAGEEKKEEKEAEETPAPTSAEAESESRPEDVGTEEAKEEPKAEEAPKEETEETQSEESPAPEDPKEEAKEENPEPPKEEEKEEPNA